MAVHPPHQGSRPFRVDVHPERDAVRLAPVGELDMSTVAPLADRLDDLRDAGFRDVVLDLRDIDFMDSAGVHLIVDNDALARDTGHDFRLIGGPPAIQRVLRLCGVLDRLHFSSP